MSLLRKVAAVLVTLHVALAAAMGTVPQEHKASIDKRADGFVNMVYFTSWGTGERNFQVADLPASDISHVLYAFAKVASNGTVYSAEPWADTGFRSADASELEGENNVYGNVQQLNLLKRKHRHIKVLLSIGGWPAPGEEHVFPSAAHTDENRKRFAQSAVGLMKDWGFDGIDVDWEHPVDGNQAADQVLLLEAVRHELDAYSARHADGHHFLLSIAASAGQHIYQNLLLAKLSSILDHINLMAYDLAGGWSPNSGHLANLYSDKSCLSVDNAVQGYTKAGVDPRKIVLGMPLYGRSFQNTAGIGHPFSGTGKANRKQHSWEAGVWDVKGLPKDGASLLYDKKAGAYYSYDDRTKELITFEIPESVKAKVSYLKRLGLGGGMFWEASNDAQGSKSLIRTSRQALDVLDTSLNYLDYPDSRYDNIRNAIKSVTSTTTMTTVKTESAPPTSVVIPSASRLSSTASATFVSSSASSSASSPSTTRATSLRHWSNSTTAATSLSTSCLPTTASANITVSTPSGVPNSTVSSSQDSGLSTASSPGHGTTRTILTTMVLTVTSCPPWVELCPTTPYVTTTTTYYTTVCPDSEMPTVQPAVTVTEAATQHHTVAECRLESGCHVSILAEATTTMAHAPSEPSESVPVSHKSSGSKSEEEQSGLGMTLTNSGPSYGNPLGGNPLGGNPLGGDAKGNPLGPATTLTSKPLGPLSPSNRASTRTTSTRAVSTPAFKPSVVGCVGLWCEARGGGNGTNMGSEACTGPDCPVTVTSKAERMGATCGALAVAVAAVLLQALCL